MENSLTSTKYFNLPIGVVQVGLFIPKHRYGIVMYDAVMEHMMALMDKRFLVTVGSCGGVYFGDIVEGADLADRFTDEANVQRLLDLGALEVLGVPTLVAEEVVAEEVVAEEVVAEEVVAEEVDVVADAVPPKPGKAK